MNKLIYFDNAATSFPKPPAVYERMDKFIRGEAANPGRSGHRMAVEAESLMNRARAVVARLFNVRDSRRIIFTLNCTDSLNMAIKGIIRQGGHIITTDLEHNSVLRPVHAVSQSQGAEVTYLQPSLEGFLDPGQVKKALRPNTRLVIVNHGSNVVGTIQPIREIGALVRETEAFFLVDAAQTAGVSPIDVEKDRIDLLAFPGHKSLFGPPGTGGLYVGERVQRISPWREGGTGTNSESAVHPEDLPFLLEGGTPNTVGIVGLLEGVQFILDQGEAKILAHERELAKNLKAGLSAIPGVSLYGEKGVERSLGTISFRMENIEPSEVGAILDQSFHIAVRTGLHCAPRIHQRIGTFPSGSVRLSPGFFNTLEEVDRVLEAIREIQAQFASL